MGPLHRVTAAEILVLREIILGKQVTVQRETTLKWQIYCFLYTQCLHTPLFITKGPPRILQAGDLPCPAGKQLFSLLVIYTALETTKRVGQSKSSYFPLLAIHIGLETTQREDQYVTSFYSPNIYLYSSRDYCVSRPVNITCICRMPLALLLE